MRADKLIEAINAHRSILQYETDCVEDAITVIGFLLWSFLVDLSAISGISPQELLANLAEDLPQQVIESGFQVERIIVPNNTVIKPH